MKRYWIIACVILLLGIAASGFTSVADNLWRDRGDGSIEPVNGRSVTIGTTYRTVSVNGVMRCIEYLNSASAVTRIDLFSDAAVTDYQNATTIGSYQWAIAQLDVTAGGHIYFNPGDYPIKTLTYITRGNLLISGSGRLSRILITPNVGVTGIGFYWPVQSTVYDVTIKDLYFLDPNPSLYSDSPANHPDQTHGIIFNNVIRGVVLNCAFENIGDESISFNPGSEDGLAFGNSFVGCPSVTGTNAGCGIDVNSAKGIRIIGNNWRGGLDGNCIHIETSGGTSSNDTLIQGNTFRNLGALVAAITINANQAMVYNTVITGNRIDATGLTNGYAITLSGGNGFTGITIADNDITGCIYLPFAELAAERITIRGNNITWPDKDLIFIAKSTAPVISGNFLSGTSQCAIDLFQCAGAVVTGNTATNCGSAGAAGVIYNNGGTKGHAAIGNYVAAHASAVRAIYNFDVTSNNIIEGGCNRSGIEGAKIISGNYINGVGGNADIYVGNENLVVGNYLADPSSTRGIYLVSSVGSNILGNLIANTTTGVATTGTVQNNTVGFNNMATAVTTAIATTLDNTNIVFRNYGDNIKTVTGTVTLQPWGQTALNGTSGAVTATLPDGSYVGQTTTITMSNATNPSTLSITNHVLAAPKVYTFDATTDRVTAQWNGTKWVTLEQTCE